jgi:hypothetical protein
MVGEKHKTFVVLTQIILILVAVAVYAIPEVNSVIQEIVNLFSYGRSNAKVFWFLGTIFMSSFIFYLKKPEKANNLRLKLVVLVSIALYGMQLTEYFSMSDEAWKTPTMSSYFFSDGHTTFSGLMHIHNSKAVIAKPLVFLGFRTPIYDIDTGEALLVFFNNWLLYPHILLYSIFLLLGWFVINDLRSVYDADVVLTYVLSFFIVSKNVIDGGLLDYEAVAAYPIFVSILIAPQYFVGKVKNRRRWSLLKTSISLSLISITAYNAVKLWLFSSISSTNYLHYFIVLAILILVFLFLHSFYASKYGKPLFIVSLTIILSSIFFYAANAINELDSTIPEGNEYGLLFPKSNPSNISGSTLVASKEIGILKYQVLRAERPTKVSEILEQTQNKLSYKAVAVPPDGSCSGYGANGVLLIQAFGPFPMLENNSFITINGVKSLGGGKYVLDYIVSRCVPNPFILIQEHIFGAGLRKFVIYS